MAKKNTPQPKPQSPSRQGGGRTELGREKGIPRSPRPPKTKK